MKRLLPDSIAGRTILVLLVGLTLSHVLSTAVYTPDRHASALTEHEGRFADRLASMAELLNRSSEEDRRSLAKVLDSPTINVSMDSQPSFADSDDDSEEVRAVRAALSPLFGAADGQRLHVSRRSNGSPWETVLRLVHTMPDTETIGVSLRLGDGSWANFVVAVARPAQLFSHSAVLSALIMALGVALFSVWATRWIGRPLATFAQAADRLGRDVNAPPLPPGGPKEVRSAAAAFNEMQDRIRRFVEDRTRMLAAISHDLRSPITRLRLRAEMLPEGDTRTRMLADLADMEEMVTSTLGFARGEGNDEAVQASDLAAMLEAICDNATDMGLTAEYRWTGRLVCVCRPLALKRALTNLIENAARYGGKAMVEATRRDRDVRVVIEDEGPGIPEDALEKVFTPFFRIEQSRNRKTGGIGLGMTVARTIIRAHGGDITLENKVGGGLRVAVTIPQGQGCE